MAIVDHLDRNDLTDVDEEKVVLALHRAVTGGIGEKGLNYHACRKEFTSLLLSSAPLPGPLSFGLSCLQQIIRHSTHLSNTDTLIHLTLASLEGVQVAQAKPTRQFFGDEQARTAVSGNLEHSRNGSEESQGWSSTPQDSGTGECTVSLDAYHAVDHYVLERRIQDMQRAQQLICKVAWGSILALSQGKRPADPDGCTEVNSSQSEYDFTRVRPRQLVRLLAVGNVDMGQLQSYVQESFSATRWTPGVNATGDGRQVIGTGDSPAAAQSPALENYLGIDTTSSMSAVSESQQDGPALSGLVTASLPAASRRPGSTVSAVDMPAAGGGSLLSDVDRMVRAYLKVLVARKAYPAAVALMQQLKISEQSSAAFLIDMVERGQINLAADWSNCLGMESVRGLVEECNARDNYKASFKIVERLCLEEHFPDAFMLYRKSSLRKLADKCMWDVAYALVGEGEDLRKYLVELTIQYGEGDLAVELCKEFNIPVSSVPLDGMEASTEIKPVLQVDDLIRLSSQSPVQLTPPGSSNGADTRAASSSSNNSFQTPNPNAPTPDLHRGNPLQAPAAQGIDEGTMMEEASGQVPGEAVEEVVLLVDSLEAVERMRERVMRSDVVGFDCEWKPKREKGWEENEVALLQLGTRSAAFLIDLATLSSSPGTMQQLNDSLALIFSSDRILKLGYGAHHDLSRLAASYNCSLPAARSCQPLLDLRVLVDHLLLRTNQQVPKGGLKGLVKHVFGRRMDSRPQMSNWEQRPLTSAQVRYAALDALVLPHLYDHYHQLAREVDPSAIATLQTSTSEASSSSISANGNSTSTAYASYVEGWESNGGKLAVAMTSHGLVPVVGSDALMVDEREGKRRWRRQIEGRGMDQVEGRSEASSKSRCSSEGDDSDDSDDSDGGISDVDDANGSSFVSTDDSGGWEAAGEVPLLSDCQFAILDAPLHSHPPSSGEGDKVTSSAAAAQLSNLTLATERRQQQPNEQHSSSSSSSSSISECASPANHTPPLSTIRSTERRQQQSASVSNGRPGGVLLPFKCVPFVHSMPKLPGTIKSALQAHLQRRMSALLRYPSSRWLPAPYDSEGGMSSIHINGVTVIHQELFWSHASLSVAGAARFGTAPDRSRPISEPSALAPWASGAMMESSSSHSTSLSSLGGDGGRGVKALRWSGLPSCSKAEAERRAAMVALSHLLGQEEAEFEAFSDLLQATNPRSVMRLPDQLIPEIVLAIVPSHADASAEAIRDHFAIPSSCLHRASDSECRQLSGFPLHCLPPVCLGGPTAVLLDPSFAQYLSQAAPDRHPLLPAPTAAAVAADGTQAPLLRQPLSSPHADKLPEKGDGGTVMFPGTSAALNGTSDADTGGDSNAPLPVSAAAAEAAKLFFMHAFPPPSSVLLDFPAGRAGLSLLLSVAGLFHVSRPIPVPGLWSKSWSRCTVHTMTKSEERAAWMPLPAFVPACGDSFTKWRGARRIATLTSHFHRNPVHCQLRILTQKPTVGLYPTKGLQRLVCLALHKSLCLVA